MAKSKKQRPSLRLIKPLRKVGNSHAITLDKKLLEHAGISIDDELVVEAFSDSRIEITKI